MSKLKYSKYKKSKALWLDKIPDHWQEIELRLLYADNKEKNIGLIERNLLSLSYGKLKRKDIDSSTGLVPASFEGYQIINTGYIILRFTDLQNDKKSLRVGYVQERGIITSAYVGLKPKTNLDSKYFYYLLHFLDTIKYFYNLGGGVRQALGYKELGKEIMLLPEKNEQTAIANFLDYKIAHIDRFIYKKKQIIKLLNEQKAVIINKAVTKGLDPKVKMKKSGVEWLDKIPEHWEVKKLKYVARINPKKGNSEFSKDSNTDVVFLPMERVTEEGDIDNSIKLPISQVWDGYTYFEKGDVLVAKITPCFENGKGAFLGNLETNIGFGTTEFIVLRPCRNSIRGQYLRHILSSKNFRIIGERFMEGAAGQKRIPSQFLKDYQLGIPTIKEQLIIEKFIHDKIKSFKNTISKIEKEIALTEEYRTALIAEAVTGKIDVRDYKIPDNGYEEENIEDEMTMAAEDEEAYEPLEN